MNRSMKSLALVLALALTTGFALYAAGQGSPFCSNPNVAIPDSGQGTLTNNLVVANSFTITDLNVSIQINHTWPGDLIVTLTKMGGPGPQTLIDQVGVPASSFGCSVDNINATLDDSGAPSVEVVCNPGPPGVGPGPYSPSPGNLNPTFAGANINGTWTLSVSDNAGGDTGTLVQWCLITTPVPVDLTDFSIE